MAGHEPTGHLTGNRCVCPSCGQLFSNPRNFDRHLRGAGRPVCVDPASVGLVLTDGGVWQMPGPAEPRRIAARERAERAETSKRDRTP